jgi:hypothetical protein
MDITERCDCTDRVSARMQNRRHAERQEKARWDRFADNQAGRMTHDEYMALPPQTKYQLEKEKRAPKRDTLTKEQLQAARAMMEPDSQKSGRPK